MTAQNPPYPHDTESVVHRIATAWQGYFNHVNGVTNPPTDEDREWADVVLGVLGRAGLTAVEMEDKFDD